MNYLAKALHLFALIVWIGAIVFFSFVVAPALFRMFPTADAGRAVGAIFPTYYVIGYACGAVLLSTSALFLVRAARRVPWAANTALAIAMLAATLYAGEVIQPRASALRPQLQSAQTAPEVRREFDHLHRRAVQLNGFVLVCGIAVCMVTAGNLKL